MGTHTPGPSSTRTARSNRTGLCDQCFASCAQAELQALAGARVCPACAGRAGTVARPEPVLREAARPSGVTSPTPSTREPRGLVAGLLADARTWSAEAAWLPRLPVLLLLAYWAVRHVIDMEYRGVIGGLNFGLHEFGHVVFAPLGNFLGIAGGTLLQCAAPLVGAAMFLRQRDYFAIAFALGWLGTNLFDVAVYVADARTQALPLVGLGSGDPIHDWAYLLGDMGLLSSDQTLAMLLRFLGALSFLAALALGAWILAQSFHAQRAAARNSI